MRDEGIDDGRGGGRLARTGGVGLLQRPRDEAVLLVGEGRLHVLAQRLGDARRLAVADRAPPREARTGGQGLLDAAVALEQLHGEVARRKVLGQLVAVGTEVGIEPAKPLLDHGAHADVDVAHALVAVLVDGDHRVEQFVDAHAVARLDGHHRHAEHRPQLLVVEVGAAGAQLVEHVQRHDHAGVYVDQFGSQVEVALEVRRHHRVDDHVGHLTLEVAAHVALLGRVGRQGVGARQVGHLEAVAAVGAVAALGPHGHAAVVAHVLAAARDGVEERGLAAVGVAYQRHRDGAAVVLDHLVERAPAGRRVGGHGFGRKVAAQVLARLPVGEHHHHVGLAAAQRDLVAHDVVFDRILERSVEHHGHPLSAHEAHLHDPAAESAVPRHLDDRGRVAGFQFG